jgi:hypothetical protein
MRDYELENMYVSDAEPIKLYLRYHDLVEMYL